MESELFGVSMELWYAFAGMVNGYVLCSYNIRVKRRIAEIKAETKMLTEAVRVKVTQRELPPESTESPEVEWASSGCELTDQILTSARNAGIHPGDFLDGVEL